MLKAEARVLQQYSKSRTSSVREILDPLPEGECFGYATVQTLVQRLEQQGLCAR